MSVHNTVTNRIKHAPYKDYVPPTLFHAEIYQDNYCLMPGEDANYAPYTGMATDYLTLKYPEKEHSWLLFSWMAQ